jgi:hypothetical protein
MKNKIICSGVLSVLALTGVANAQTSSGTLGVSATVSGSIVMLITKDTSGMTVGGSSSAATFGFGTVSYYGGTPPTGVTKTLQAGTSFTLATPFDVEVDVANSNSTTFSLAATLTTADTVNSWTVNGFPITSTSGPITSTGGYGAPASYAFNLVVPITLTPVGPATTSPIANTLNFVATAN